jgi:hypothetical protein
MLRHTALFLLGETVTAADRQAMLDGLASLFTECPTVRGGDYGEALPGDDGVGRYDVALHLDFDGLDEYEEYVAHPVHVAVSSFNATLAVEGTTARIDWEHDRPAAAGAVRHCEVLEWNRVADASARRAAIDTAASIAGADGVVSAVAAENAGRDRRAAHWLLDVELADETAARSFLTGAGYREVAAVVAPAVDASRTAWITHLVRR